MTDTNKLKELAERAVDDFGSFDPSEAEQEFMEQITPQDVLGLIAEVERLRGQVEHLINQHMPREPIPDMPGWSRVIDADRLKAENTELRRLCSCAKQYDISKTLRGMIDAALEGGGR